MQSSRFIIYCDALEPEAVTGILGVEPSKRWKKGDRMSVRKEDGSIHLSETVVHRADGWKLDLPNEDKLRELDDQIACWIAVLAPKKRELAQIRAAGCEAVLNCCTIGGSDSICLSPPTIAQLAELSLTLDVTFYASAEEEPNQAPEPTAPSGRGSS